MATRNYKAEVTVSADSIAPAAGAVIADTGALPAGKYDIEVTMAVLAAAAPGQGVIIEHRNAANAATLNRLGGTSAGCSEQIFVNDWVLALNERIRVVAGTQNIAATGEVQAMVRARQYA